jgi:hypothetical protein
MSIKVIKPDSIDQCTNNFKTIFLAGTIDNGNSFDWQKDIEYSLDNLNQNIALLNPRRNNWDPSLQQRMSNQTFNEQVNWEMNNINKCDILFMNFLEDSLSPISLLELGIIYGIKTSKEINKQIIVIAPDKFWRKGNIEVVCNRMNVPVYSDYKDGLNALIKAIGN